MTHRLWTRPLAVTLALLAAVPPVGAQITSNAGDGVLHAPYCGTVTSLREATMPVGYGEVMNHTEPRYGALTLSSNTVTLSGGNTAS